MQSILQVTSEKEKSELAKQWKIIDGSKLNANLPKQNAENLAPKNSNLGAKNSNLAPLLLSEENLPKLAPTRLEEKFKLDERQKRHEASQKRHETSKKRHIVDDGEESVCSECQSVCGSQCTCSEASLKM